MKFPYPENLSDWQTAYTRDDAFKEYGKLLHFYWAKARQAPVCGDRSSDARAGWWT